MRAIKRIRLPSRPAAWLLRQQSQLDADATIDLAVRWKARRTTMNNNGVLTTLKEMAGYRERCMYCGDSQACDIEHFKPKKDYRGTAFQWGNFLWICQPCNRRKSKNFPVSLTGDPLILDPSLVDPWFYFIYVKETGEIIPRPTLIGINASKTAHTVNPKYTRLNIECVSEGRRRDARTLTRSATKLVSTAGAALDEAEFIEAITDLDHPELTEWFLRREGSLLPPFCDVLGLFPVIVNNAMQALNWCHPGI